VTGGFRLTTTARDGGNGSGIDRVEFWSGNPSTIGTRIASDDHDSNPEAGLSAADSYTAVVAEDPGSLLFTKVFDQAGNLAICSAAGTLQSTNDLVQVAAAITEDTVAPTIADLDVWQQCGGWTAKATWTPWDDKTAVSSLSYVYAIDKPIDQWDDPDVVFAGQLATPEITLDISSLPEGQHTFTLAAFDEEGNIGTGSRSFTTGHLRIAISTAQCTSRYDPISKRMLAKIVGKVDSSAVLQSAELFQRSADYASVLTLLRSAAPGPEVVFEDVPDGSYLIRVGNIKGP